MLNTRQSTAPGGVRTPGAALAMVLVIAATGCVGSSAGNGQTEPVTLKIGFGGSGQGCRRT
jgi:hypothetical protein